MGHGGEYSYHAQCCVLEMLHTIQERTWIVKANGLMPRVIERVPARCPHCGNHKLHAHGYCRRNACAMGRDEARKGFN